MMEAHVHTPVLSRRRDRAVDFDTAAWHDELAVPLDLGVARPPEYGDFGLDLKSKRLKRLGTDASLKLSDRLYQVMWLLMRARGSLIPIASIKDFVFESAPEGYEEPLSNSMEVSIAYLRRLVLDFSKKEMFINTKRGFGYYLGLASKGQVPTSQGTLRTRERLSKDPGAEHV